MVGEGAGGSVLAAGGGGVVGGVALVAAQPASEVKTNANTDQCVTR